MKHYRIVGPDGLYWTYCRNSLKSGEKNRTPDLKEVTCQACLKKLSEKAAEKLVA